MIRFSSWLDSDHNEANVTIFWNDDLVTTLTTTKDFFDALQDESVRDDMIYVIELLLGHVAKKNMGLL